MIEFEGNLDAAANVYLLNDLLKGMDVRNKCPSFDRHQGKRW